MIGTQCFVDAAWNAGTRGGGFGCIFKDMNNSTFHHHSSNRSFVGSAFAAEALAAKAALQVAVTLGTRMLAVWSDSKPLVLAISLNAKVVEAQGTLFDISQLCNNFVSIFSLMFQGYSTLKLIL
ncbi:hypothetical protein Bca52824_068397 [Brassica carinata]|uniref:RNase H type-1 domain-containing protein n=1 Tax=Brassica carinata TaxID=52824 RepID=A0A8X7Q3M7_BRACI|nr:hypothetical protein Bca52824_068397 [Brassica carinata]